MKRPRIKIKRLNISGFLKYILTVLFSSVILALILISLPLTERVTNSATYDLNNKKNLYWSKEYTIELDTKDSLNPKVDIEKVKSVLYKRLRDFNVERSSMRIYEKDSKSYIEIKVQTSTKQEVIDSLISSPFIVNIVTRKADIDFDNTEDTLTPYLLENYELTQFTRSSFRNIYVTQLKNSNNEYSYFALFKTWPWSGEWNTFLEENAGQMVGVAIDDFVTPVQVPVDQNLFAVSVSATEKDVAKVISTMYNSGQMPISYTLIEQKDLPIDIAEIDYIKLTEGILVAIFLIYLYLLLINKTSKDILLKSALSTVLTIAIWIAYLKISETPIDIFILALEVITVVAIIRMITENIESRMIVTVLLALIASMSVIFGSGYIKMFAYDLLILIILSNISIYVSSMYISNVRRVLKI